MYRKTSRKVKVRSILVVAGDKNRKYVQYVPLWPPLKAGAIMVQLYISVMPRKKLVSTSPKHHTLRGYTGEEYKTRKCRQFPLRVPKIDLKVSTSSKKGRNEMALV